MADEKDKLAEFLLEVAERQGAVCSTTTDGHLLLFKRSLLQDILDKHPNNDKIMIFVKRPDFKN